jgi:hypothetical protein
MGGTAMTWGTENDRWPQEPQEAQEPQEPDDEYPGFLWPDDEDGNDEDGNDEDGTDEQPAAGPPRATGPGAAPGAPVPFLWGVPPEAALAQDRRDRRRRLVTLGITAVVALGLGAGAVLTYRDAQAGSAPAAASSPAASQAPGQGGGLAGPGGAQGSVTEMQIVARVTAVGSGTITIGGGPVQAVRAAVTRATRFTGSVRTLAAVRVGDIVAAQIEIEGDVARVVILQDPVSES